MNFKQSLDRYLTTPPNDGYTDFSEAVIEAFTEDFFDENEIWIMDETEQINLWLDRFHYRDYSPEEAARIIERAHRMFIKKNNVKIYN